MNYLANLPDEIMRHIYMFLFENVLEEIQYGNDDTRCDCCTKGLNRELIWGKCSCICSNCGKDYRLCQRKKELCIMLDDESRLYTALSRARTLGQIRL